MKKNQKMALIPYKPILKHKCKRKIKTEENPATVSGLVTIYTN